MISYQVGDGALTAEAFLKLVNRVWPGEYDLERTEAALARTLNITARDGGELVGCLRILSDGCYFGTITELLVLPATGGAELAASYFASRGKMPLPCSISARSPDWNPFTNEMDAAEACNPMNFPRRNAACRSRLFSTVYKISQSDAGRAAYRAGGHAAATLDRVLHTGLKDVQVAAASRAGARSRPCRRRRGTRACSRSSSRRSPGRPCRDSVRCRRRPSTACRKRNRNQRSSCRRPV